MVDSESIPPRQVVRSSDCCGESGPFPSPGIILSPPWLGESDSTVPGGPAAPAGPDPTHWLSCPDAERRARRGPGPVTAVHLH
eukprot:513518-Hanusia_phi.AAC.1